MPHQVCLQVLGCSLNYSSIWYLQWPVCAASYIMQYSYTDFWAFFGSLQFLHDINMQLCPKCSPDTENAGDENDFIRVWTCASASVGAFPFYFGLKIVVLYLFIYFSTLGLKNWLRFSIIFHNYSFFVVFLYYKCVFVFYLY